MGVEPNAWSRALPVLCADLLRHWERDARFLCCQKIHIQFSTAEPGGSVYLPHGAFRNCAAARPGGRALQSISQRVGGHMGPPLRFRRTALITGSASLIRSLRDHLLLKGKAWRAGEDTRPYADAGTVPFSSQGPVPDRPAGAHCAPLQRKTAPGRWFGKLRRRSGTAIAVIFRLLRPPVGPDGMAPKHTWSCAPEGLCPL